MVGVTGRPAPWSRIRSLPDETSREACSIGSLTSTPTKRLYAPKRFTNQPSASSLEQPRSTIQVSGFTNFEPTSRTVERMISYGGIDRTSMSSKTDATRSDSHRSPDGI